MNNIERTIEYVKNLFETSEYLKNNPLEKEYRLNHTFRVASIGKEIAEKENLDVDAVVVGCLLHDISYINEMESKEDRLNHGRASAEIARDFVMALDMDIALKNQLLYGVAIHVDDKSDFDGERTVIAELVSECDNIDRFDRYRLYEALLYSGLNEMSLNDQIEYVSKRIERLSHIKENFTFKTRTSNTLWNEKLDYQLNYFRDLKRQFEKSYL